MLKKIIPPGGAPAPASQASSAAGWCAVSVSLPTRGRQRGPTRLGRPRVRRSEAGLSSKWGGAGRSGAGPSRAGRGLEVIPETRGGSRGAGKPKGQWWRRRRELGPEARGRAVGPRNEVSAGPAGSGRDRFRAGAAHLGHRRDRSRGRGSNRLGASSLQPQGLAPAPTPGNWAGRRGSWSSRALRFKSLKGPGSLRARQDIHFGLRKLCAVGEMQQRGLDAGGRCGPGSGSRYQRDRPQPPPTARDPLK
ncbi:hypothetical protein P7K49_001403 [Saguinus oedipus]|uniref:Uncharacterized protein n=1 Tax=Saguinus oedipus TaxID=9490 RepID=A0ABQ9WEE6_SAGOE|nr:hypothetical protein P7K49_001403 [Saguinus oedipus]